jgi:hypothetical protein
MRSLAGAPPGRQGGSARLSTAAAGNDHVVTTADFPRPNLEPPRRPGAEVSRSDLAGPGPSHSGLSRAGDGRYRAGDARYHAGDSRYRAGDGLSGVVGRTDRTASAGMGLTPVAPLPTGPLRCPSCELGLAVLEVLGDLRFRCDRCLLEWRYGMGQLWGVGDGLGDQVP